MLDQSLESLRGKFREDFFSFDPAELKQFGTDWTKLFEPNPGAICFPKTTEEVSEILKICNERGIPVVPSGGRTGLAGGALAKDGELVISLSKMNQIGKVDLLSLTLPVQAGAITEAVHQSCEPHGLTWPVDFGSKGSSTVGGNISTNAGGINVIRYGMTRNWVLGLTVVTMNGEVLRLNGALEKNNTGLDLKHLFIGSEGILGMVTEAVLKLTHLEKNRELFFFATSELSKVFQLLEATRASPISLHAFEVFSRNCFDATAKALGFRTPFENSHAYYVLVEGISDSFEAWLENAFAKEFVIEGVQPKNKEEGRQFWKVRESIAEILRSHGLNHSNDISVPVYCLNRFLEDWTSSFRNKYPTWQQFVFGHFGDGNLHIHALKPEEMSKEEFVKQAHKVDEDLFGLVKKYEGSISAEHGVGLLKKENLFYSKTPTEIEILKQIKKILDPRGLLNPGKVIDQ